jgi:glycosyltransferase involved in cell wall biosynthesis
MPVLYRLADILCLPSMRETWGLVVNEFMASKGGQVLLSDRVGCAQDIVTSENYGRVISFMDSKAWANAIQNCARNVAKKRMKFDEEFSFSKFLEAIQKSL